MFGTSQQPSLRDLLQGDPTTNKHQDLFWGDSTINKHQELFGETLQ